MDQSNIRYVYKGRRSEYVLVDYKPFAFGPYSRLYRAVDSDNSLVVIKTFPLSEPLENWNLFYNELMAGKLLDHPNILPVLDFGTQADIEFGYISPFLVVPYCKGGSFLDLFKHFDFLNLSHILPWIEQVALAIDYSHSRGVIHGDIKPSNILFLDEKKNHVVLADFGIAKFFPISDEITQPPLSKAKSEEGPSLYVSPEQLVSHIQTPQSDIYSFALIIFRMITGRMPFDVSSPLYQQIKSKIDGKLLDAYELNPVVYPGVSKVLKKALSPSPNHRPQRAIEFVDELRLAQTHFERKAFFRLPSFWKSLSPQHRIMLFTGIITAVATIVAAIISVMFK